MDTVTTGDKTRLCTTLPEEDADRFERHCRSTLGLTPATQLRRLIYAELARATPDETARAS